MGDYLFQKDVPLQEATWQKLEEVMIQTARSLLVGRRILPVEGPYGLGLSAVPLEESLQEGVRLVKTVGIPSFSEVFSLSKRMLAAFEENGVYLNLRPLQDAVSACARKEDSLVFQGISGVPGLLKAEGSKKSPLSAWNETGEAVEDVIKAINVLEKQGVPGPYLLVLAPERFNLLFRRYPSGNQLEIEHMRLLCEAGVLKSPVLEEGGILLGRGGKVGRIILAQDMQIGFIGPTEDSLEFYVSEALLPLVEIPEAICVLK
ncbi:family 1 encapsulin nanocompartment shell protein [Atrimonas thermophila]|uniref:family 1 encapsulin nanocompartment shell protein n=1 Tax=Atrimonas thermophila TaxID=3064161 RepID=UPI00399CA0CE